MKNKFFIVVLAFVMAISLGLIINSKGIAKQDSFKAKESIQCVDKKHDCCNNCESECKDCKNCCHNEITQVKNDNSCKKCSKECKKHCVKECKDCNECSNKIKECCNHKGVKESGTDKHNLTPSSHCHQKS